MRIKALRHPGGETGVIPSRNLGLRHSAGRYIARLDADDAFRPTAFEDQIAISEAHPSVAMTYGPWRYGKAGRQWREPPLFSIVHHSHEYAPGSAPRLAPFLSHAGNEPVGMFVRREVMESVGRYTAGSLHRSLTRTSP